jgi:hypothetical protein
MAEASSVQEEENRPTKKRIAQQNAFVKEEDHGFQISHFMPL